MSIARATLSALCVAFVGTFSALAIATRLSSGPARDLSAPEGWAALNRGDAAAAAAIFRDELARHPRDPDLHFGAGAAAFAMGRSDTALLALQEAVALDPQFVEALTMLADVAYAKGKGDLAVQSIEKAAALRPRDRRIAERLSAWRTESSLHSSFIEQSGGRFRILFEGTAQKAVGDRVADVLEREYRRIGRLLNSYPADLTVILYTNRQFQDLTRAPVWAAGRYDGRIRLAVGGALQSPEDLDRVVAHEFVHAVVAGAAPGGVPAWLDEGLASHLDSSDRAWAREAISHAETVVPLSALVNGFGAFDEENAIVAYAESQIAAEILCAKLGANIAEFLRMVGNGGTVDDGLLAFNVQPDAFHQEWRRRVGLQ
jgi:tetratricopeptide (TPR) repeat protein